MAANETQRPPTQDHHGLKLKDGAYLTPRVERIMMHVARRRSVKWIASLHGVHESWVCYIACKTGFPTSALVGYDGKTQDKERRQAQ